MIKHYINLTNGIEAIQIYNLKQYSFIRIQSTACEQKRWDFIIQDLDVNFLMDIALGYCARVYDFSQKREAPRSIWQGLEWIKYVLNRRWLDREILSQCRGCDVTEYFNTCYKKLDRKTKTKLDYYKKFLTTDTLLISSITSTTENDGDYDYYKKILVKGISQ